MDAPGSLSPPIPAPILKILVGAFVKQRQSSGGAVWGGCLPDGHDHDAANTKQPPPLDPSHGATGHTCSAGMDSAGSAGFCARACEVHQHCAC